MSKLHVRSPLLTRSQTAIGATFLFTGTMHFVAEKFFTGIVPKSLPNPKAITYVSGAAELAGGLGVLIPQTRRAAGLGLIALLLAVFPANIQMAVNAEHYSNFPVWGLWARLPLQFVLIAWVWRATQPHE